LIVTREHYDVFLNTPAEVLHDIMDAALRIAPAIVAAVGADGFNLALNNGEAAGQAVFHTHFHLIPRFANDGFKHWPHKPYPPGEIGKVADAIKKNLK
jgi:histidine triad (HIT) family protein